VGEAKKRGTYEERLKKALKSYKENSHKCLLFGEVKYKGKTLFSGIGECLIPDEIGKDDFGSEKWRKSGNRSIGVLADSELYKKSAGVILNVMGHYLQHSTTLWSARHFKVQPEQSICFRSGHIHTCDLNALGCVIEFEIKDHPEKGRGVSTNGPRWMKQADVIKEAKSKGLMKETA
jgi:hypothetical protein